MSSSLIITTRVFNLYSFRWRYWEMTSDPVLPGSSIISNYLYKFKLQLIELRLYDLYLPFILQDIRWHSSLSIIFQYSVDFLRWLPNAIFMTACVLRPYVNIWRHICNTNHMSTYEIMLRNTTQMSTYGIILRNMNHMSTYENHIAQGEPQVDIWNHNAHLHILICRYKKL